MRIMVKTPTLTSYKMFENFCKIYGIFFSLGPPIFLYLFILPIMYKSNMPGKTDLDVL